MATQAKKPGQDQQLPGKEAALFRNVVKCYESKQFKKGIKAADQILKKFPDHGETLSMKGLTLNCMNKKEEAYELVRKGLKCDLKSHVCWHVYGLLYRSDRVYAEAAKCYLNALRIDKDNQQILIDLANLQVQLREYSGFVQTRNRLLNLKPTNRNNWIGLAVAHHLNGNPDVAVAVLEAYQGTVTEVAAADQYEHSELLLYEASVLEEAGKPAEALAFLQRHRRAIVDLVSLNEAVARLHLALGEREQAAELYRKLLRSNADCHAYHAGLWAALGLPPLAQAEALTPQQVELLSAEYARLRQEHPRSSCCRRLPLDFLQGAAFESALSDYVRPFLRKGVPSLFADLRPLYATPAKLDALERVVAGAADSLRARSAFPGQPDGSERPGVLPWALMLLAEHRGHQGRLADALAAADEALSHSPTVIDVYLVKAELLERRGDAEGAAEVADEARRMDLADRYLNCVAVKKLLLAGKVKEAEETVSLFARAQEGGGDNLVDMQCMWYEIASGECHARARAWGPALKRFHQVRRHFEDFQEDQFDFHAYCVRKAMLRHYVGLLRVSATLPGHDFYKSAARGAVRVYLALSEERERGVGAEGAQSAQEAELAALPPNERKKLKAKLRKEEERRKKEEEEAEAARSGASKAGDAKAGGAKAAAATGKVKEKDPDPHGKLLADTADPLGEATKFLQVLLEHASGELETQLLAAEVYRRKGRLLLALRAAARAVELAPEDREARLAAVRVAAAVEALPAEGQPGAAPAVVRGVLAEGVQTRLLKGGKGGAKELAAALGEAGAEAAAQARAAVAALIAKQQEGGEGATKKEP